MAEITAALVKELRDATGISMMKCKEALTEANGDMEKARDILRKQGEKDAAKKSSRDAGEGRIAVQISKDGKRAVAVKLLCETDFAARGDDFVKLANDIAELALNKGVEIAKKESEELIKSAFTKIGENLKLADIKELEGVSTGSYIHSNNKIGVMVTLKKGTNEVAKDIAMQVAAMNPAYLLPTDVPEEEVAKEKEIAIELLKKEGKPEAMLEKILPGKLQKFRDEQSLVKQPFVKDQSKTVEQFLKEVNAEIEKFVRLAI